MFFFVLVEDCLFKGCWLDFLCIILIGCCDTTTEVDRIGFWVHKYFNIELNKPFSTLVIFLDIWLINLFILILSFKNHVLNFKPISTLLSPDCVLLWYGVCIHFKVRNETYAYIYIHIHIFIHIFTHKIAINMQSLYSIWTYFLPSQQCNELHVLLVSNQALSPHNDESAHIWRERKCDFIYRQTPLIYIGFREKRTKEKRTRRDKRKGNG